MASTQPTLSLYSRPSLPSLHALGLPNPVKETLMTSSYNHDDKNTTISEHTTWHRARQVSISSTTSSRTDSSGRSTPPCDADTSDFTRSPVSPPSVYLPSNDFSLVRSTMEEANAFVLVPSHQRPYVENISAYSRSHASPNRTRRNQALLVVGPALEYLRHPKLRLSKGSRVHPYRIVPHSARCQSTSSTVSPHDIIN